MTLYADGADFAKDNALVGCLVKLLQLNLTVAIVTAAGYGVESERYEKRLSGLLQGIQDSLDLDHEQRGRFFVMGGECNYLFRWDPALQHLVYIPENEIHATLISKSNTVAIGGASLSVQTPPLSTNTSSSASTSTAPPPSLLKWASNKEKIAQLVNVAHSCLVETVNAMGVTDRVEIIRKERAVGLVVKKGCEGLTREQVRHFKEISGERVVQF